jgi:hypothetical protein
MDGARRYAIAAAMIVGRRERAELWTLVALLALALKVLTPPGFMVSQTPGAFPLVICTGHGPLKSADLPIPGDTKTHQGSDKACAFAGHGLAPTLTQAPTLTASLASYAAVVAIPAGHPVPGRGLAAPPPPSQAPPLSL